MCTTIVLMCVRFCDGVVRDFGICALHCFVADRSVGQVCCPSCVLNPFMLLQVSKNSNQLSKAGDKLTGPGWMHLQ